MTTHNTERAEEIAAGLSEQAAKALRKFDWAVGYGPGMPDATSAFKGPLGRKGLLRREGINHYLTPLGFDVQTQLIRAEANNA